MYGERRTGGFRPRDGGMGMSTPPVKVGDELDVTIEAVGEKGDGLAKKNGFVLFIPGVKEGQQVHVRVTKVLRKVGFAEVVGEGAPAAAPSEEAPAETETFGEEAPAEAPAEEAPAEETPAESSEDSESFGEETTEETTEEETPGEES